MNVHRLGSRACPTAPLLAVAVALSAAAVAAPGALAAPPAPQTLTPPPPDFEACKTAGNGTICSGVRTFSYGPEDTGIVCGSGDTAFSVLDSATDEQRAIRFYDANGNLTRVVLHDAFSAATLSNSVTRSAVSYTQQTKSTLSLPVPGDFRGSSETITGHINVNLPHLGAVLQSTGRVVFDNDTGIIEFAAGQLDIDAYYAGDTSAVAGLCAALERT